MAPFQQGDLVIVESRTSPGINQPGGVGRVTQVNPDSTLNVRYVLDQRHEKSIALEYVKPHEQSMNRSLRDRSMLLGRCSRCGSLRKDCGFCENQTASDSEDSLERLVRNVDNQISKANELQKKAKRVQESMHRYLESDSDDSILREMEQARKERRTARHMRQQVIILSDDEDSVQSSILDIPADDHGNDDEGVSVNSQLSFASKDIDPDEEDNIPLAAIEIADESTQPQYDEEDLEHDFIQPEGSAEVLPEEVRDLTKDIPFSELPRFLDDLMQELESSKLPRARRDIVNLEKEWKDAETSDRKRDILRRSDSLHEHLIRSLVRKGVDQCHLTMRRLSSRRLYRENKSSISAEVLKEFRRSQMDLREFRSDTLSETVESIMSKLRAFIRHIEDEIDDESVAMDEDDGWVDPGESQSPLHSAVREEDGTLSSVLSPFDAHRHATKKRRRLPAENDSKYLISRRWDARLGSKRPRTSGGNVPSGRASQPTRGGPRKNNRRRDTTASDFVDEKENRFHRDDKQSDGMKAARTTSAKRPSSGARSTTKATRRESPPHHKDILDFHEERQGSDSIHDSGAGICPLKSIRALFEEDGIIYLQETLAHRSSKSFGLLVKALAAICDIDGPRDDSSGSATDDLTVLLGTTIRKAIAVQLVECCFSLFHENNPWALSLRRKEAAFGQLDCLRDVLSKHLNLLDFACKCLSSLPRQEWRYNPKTRTAFVACFEMKTLSDCSSIAASVESQSSGRLAEIRDPLPKSEVDAIWSTLGYFSRSSLVLCTNHPFVEWKFLSGIFLRGVLYADEADESLPPATSQLEAAEAQIDGLAQLLASPCMHETKVPDSFFSNLILKCLTLGAKYLEGESEAEGGDAPEILHRESETCLLKRLESMTQTVDDASSPFMLPKGLYLLVSDASLRLPDHLSRLYRRIFDLSESWLIRVPQKRVRLKRLDAAVTSLSLAMESGIRIEETNVDPFLAAFSVPSPLDQDKNIADSMLKSCSSYFLGLSYFVKSSIQSTDALTAIEVKEVWSVMTARQSGHLSPCDRTVWAYVHCIMVLLHAKSVVGFDRDSSVLHVSSNTLISPSDTYKSVEFLLDKYSDALSSITEDKCLAENATIVSVATLFLSRSLKLLRTYGTSTHEPVLASSTSPEILDRIVASTGNMILKLAACDAFTEKGSFALKAIICSLNEILTLWDHRFQGTSETKQLHETISTLLLESRPSKRYNYQPDENTLSTTQGRQLVKKSHAEICALLGRLSVLQGDSSMDCIQGILSSQSSDDLLSKESLTDSGYLQLTSVGIASSALDFVTASNNTKSFIKRYDSSLQLVVARWLGRPLRKFGCPDLLHHIDPSIRAKESSLIRKVGTDEDEDIISLFVRVVECNEDFSPDSRMLASCLKQADSGETRNLENEYSHRIQILAKICERLKEERVSAEPFIKNFLSTSSIELIQLYNEAKKARSSNGGPADTFTGLRHRSLFNYYFRFHIAMVLVARNAYHTLHALEDALRLEQYLSDMVSGCTIEEAVSKLLTLSKPRESQKDDQHLDTRSVCLEYACPMALITGNSPGPRASLLRNLHRLSLESDETSWLFARALGNPLSLSSQILSTTLLILGFDFREGLSKRIHRERSSLILDDILSMLGSKSKSRSKATYWRSVRYLLESTVAGMEASAIDDTPTDSKLVCSIVWTAYTAMISEFKKSLDEESLIEILDTIRGIVRLPSNAFDADAIGWTIDWCNLFRNDDCSVWDSNTRALHSTFIWNTLQVLFHIVGDLAGSTSLSLEVVRAFRVGDNDDDTWLPPAFRDKPLLSYASFKNTALQLFGATKKAKIVNIYATQKKAETVRSLDDFTFSTKLQRAAQALRSEIQSLT